MTKSPNWVKFGEKILSFDKKMRFVAIIDLKGNITEGIMKEGKLPWNPKDIKSIFVYKLHLEEKCVKSLIKV